MGSNIKKYGELDWLTDESFVPSKVTVHTNKKRINKTPSLGEKYDAERYRSMGYIDGKPKYSTKKGKVPPFSNPFMWEGI